MKEVLRTNDPTVIAFATALLEGEGIGCFSFDVHMSVLEGSIGILPRRLILPDRRQRTRSSAGVCAFFSPESAIGPGPIR